MNESKNKRVILINGDNSKWYEQAIFIVKKNAASQNIPVDFVAEAEKIINSYMLKTSGGKYTSSSKKTRQGATILINSLLICTCILIVIMLFFLL